MDNWKVMANRAGNTLYSAGASVASVGKERGMQAFQAASEVAAVGAEKVKGTQAFQTATIAAVVGKEKVKSTQAFQAASSAASSAATVGKEKATTAASVAASAANAGKVKAAAALIVAKNRLGRPGSANNPPDTVGSAAELPSGEKEFYKYEMTDEEKRKKRAQARRRIEKNALGVNAPTREQEAHERSGRTADSTDARSGRSQSSSRTESRRDGSSNSNSRSGRSQSRPRPDSSGASRSNHRSASSSRSQEVAL